MLKAFWIILPALWFALPRFALCAESRLEEMAREADLVFKGQALSSARITNSGFHNPQMDVHATTLKVISILKGSAPGNEVVFQHYSTGPGAWSGASPPPYYRFEIGRCYLVFAAGTGKEDKYYSPLPGTNGPRNEFRQLTPYSHSDDDGVIRSSDCRPLVGLSVKNAYWLELNFLLTDSVFTNALYAIGHLNSLSTNCASPWGHTDDFKREAVLEALSPLLTNANDEVAVSALGCFRFGPECAAQITRYAATLIQIATDAPSAPRRVAAIGTFSGTKLKSLTNALPHWLGDANEDARAQAVRLLLDFPGEFSERALRGRAGDSSAKVRSAVAETIGAGRMEQLLPTLVKLLSDPAGLTNPIPPSTIETIQEGSYPWSVNLGNVHASAGFALLKFDLAQVSEILKTHLNDEAMRPNYLCKLAETNTGPWLGDLTAYLESRRIREEKKAVSWGADPKTYRPALSGNSFKCWNLIYEYLHGLPFAAFANGKSDRYLDALELAGDTGSQEPLKLYELFRMKGLNKRAVRFRKANKQRIDVYGVSKFFDEVDAKYPNNGMIPDQ